MPRYKNSHATPCTMGVVSCHVKTERRSKLRRNMPICDGHYLKFFTFFNQ